MELGKIILNLLSEKKYFIDNREYLEENKYGVLKEYNTGDIILKELDNINKAVVLVEGEVYVSRYSKTGDNIITGKMKQPQIFNLLEIAGNRTSVEGTVVALSKVKVFEIPINILKKSLNDDTLFLKISLKYISELTLNLMDMSLKKSSLSVKENILNYFYQLVTVGNLPLEIKQSKSFIADLFGINVRSLYRYLNTWEKEGILERRGQSIIINKENLQRLKLAIEDL